MKQLLLALCCASGAVGARTPFQGRCEATLGAAVMAVSVADAGYTIDNTLSSKALSSLKGRQAIGRANWQESWQEPWQERGQQAGNVVLGLTRAESRISFGLAGPMLGDPVSGDECVSPQVMVSLAYLPIVVYVGSEFLPGTCAYTAILAHEMRHLNAYQGHLPKVATALRAALAKRFAGTPVYAQGGQAKRLLEQELANGWIPYTQHEMGKVAQVQAAIDSPQEYARLSKVCRGELQLALGSPQRQKR